MSLNKKQPSGQKFPTKIYKYVGNDQPEFKNMLFQRIAEFDAGKDGKITKEKWPAKEDEWKFDFSSDTVFLMNIRNDLQPPPMKKMFCSVIETPEEVEVGNEGAGGFIFECDEKYLSENFEMKGKQ